MNILSQLRRKPAPPPQRLFFGLRQLDRKLEQYLDFDNGFFIEAGANDGIKQSNTLHFERFRHWKGLLVEAIPELANQCRQNRGNCIVENAALVASDYPLPTIPMRYAHLMSVVKGSLKEDEHRQIHNGMAFQKLDATYEVDVPALPLSRILDKHSITQVDLLSLDVEGYEVNALNGLDFQRHRPRFILVEARDRSAIANRLSPWYSQMAVLDETDGLADILYTCAS